MLLYEPPEGYLESQMEYHHREQDIVEYWYQIFDEEKLHSAWILRFYNSVSFIGRVSKIGWNR